MVLSIRSIEGALSILNKTSCGRGSLYATDLASISTCSLSTLGMFFIEKPSNDASILRTVSMYFPMLGLDSSTFVDMAHDYLGIILKDFPLETNII